MDESTCRACGVVMPPRPVRSGMPKRFCSATCRVRAHKAANPDRLAAYRSVQRARDRAAVRATREALGPLECPQCGASFVPRHGNQKFCSNNCTDCAAARMRRVRAAGAGREPYTVMEIANRDGWACSICAEPVDRALVYPDAMSRSIDHVIPLAGGGSDTPGNVALAHLVCNIRKGDKVLA